MADPRDLNVLEETATKKDGNPEFLPNLVISTASLVTDRNGKLWWIDPEAKYILPA